MIMKKFVLYLLITVMLCMSFVGCYQDTDNDKPIEGDNSIIVTPVDPDDGNKDPDDGSGKVDDNKGDENPDDGNKDDSDSDDKTESVMKLFDTVNEHNIDKVITAPNFTIDESVKESTEAFTPAGVISDHMVLQRNAVSCLWGKTNFNGPFAVKINDVTCYGTAVNNSFEIYLSPMKAGGPYDITFYCQNGKKSVKDVLIGDVILFSGQSNMEWFMEYTLSMGKQYVYSGNPAVGGTYIPDSTADPVTYQQYVGSETIKQEYKDMAQSLMESNSNIRLCSPRYALTLDQIAQNSTPQTDLVCKWKAASTSDRSIIESSMFAYLFAKRLQAAVNIPIGVMTCAVGGTNVPAWVKREVVTAHSSDFAYGNNDDTANNGANTTSRCYNTFIAPLTKFTFRSVVWYQGEGQPTKYSDSMKRLIASWREEMDEPDMGFLIVELPMFGNGDTYQLGYDQTSYRNASIYTGMEAQNYFPCRKEQQKIAAEVENCALSVSINTGDYDDIHPSDKRVIASQACDKYIEVFYGSTELLSGPVLNRSEREDEYVILYFDNVGDGLQVKNGGRNFQISQDGKKWYEVYAEKDGKAALMLSPKNTPIKTINYVRYGALNYPRISRLDMSGYVSLFNSKGYPCDQFEIKVDK